MFHVSSFMVVLVTGCAGFIGSHLAERLLRENFRVIGLDNFNNFYDPAIKERNLQTALGYKNFSLYRGDIRSETLLNKIFHKEKPEIIIHLAARAGVRPSLDIPAEYMDTNITGTVRLLEASRRAKVKHFVFGSSSSIYGASTKLPFTEKTSPDLQLSPYGMSKRAGELACYTYNQLYGFPITLLRFFTVYGPRQRPEMAIAYFTRCLNKNKPITVFGNPEKSGRDYTYIDDIIDGIMAALNRKLNKQHLFRIYNLGNSSPISLAKLITLLEKACNKKAELDRQSFQVGDMKYTYADISRAKKELGWQPKVSIEEGLAKYVEWVKNSERKEQNAK